MMLFALRYRSLPTLLVNARLSEKSFTRWKYVPESSRRWLWSCFSGILAQSAQDATFFRALGAENVTFSGNLKYAASALPCDESLLLLLQEKTAGRPLWVAASLHPGEEEIVLSAHKRLKASFPSLLTIFVPRHPKHTIDLMRKLKRENVAQRSSGTLPEPWQEFYIVDSFGELGTLYHLADIVFVGGSFVPVGGHNLIEPAQLECAILHGPHMEKCQEIAALFRQHAAAIQVNDATAMASVVKDLLEHPKRCAALKAAAKDLASTQRHVLKAFDTFATPHFQHLKQN
jgi:3-deoxy-D-manno-octulosonic-acid transferase